MYDNSEQEMYHMVWMKQFHVFLRNMSVLEVIFLLF